MTQLTKDDLKQVLKEVGVVTKNDLKVMGVVTEKVLKKELNKTKKELIQAISNVAVSSPTINQFNGLERRVSNLEAYAN
ncbi:MAG: hypothetical protein AAB954_01130 [Patescibacteria group bacterium]